MQTSTSSEYTRSIKKFFDDYLKYIAVAALAIAVIDRYTRFISQFFDRWSSVVHFSVALILFSYGVYAILKVKKILPGPINPIPMEVAVRKKSIFRLWLEVVRIFVFRGVYLVLAAAYFAETVALNWPTTVNAQVGAHFLSYLLLVSRPHLDFIMNHVPIIASIPIVEANTASWWGAGLARLSHFVFYTVILSTAMLIFRFGYNKGFIEAVVNEMNARGAQQ